MTLQEAATFVCVILGAGGLTLLAIDPMLAAPAQLINRIDVAIRGPSVEMVVSELLTQNPCPGESAADFSCWDTYYENVLQKHPAQVALFELKGRYDGGGYPRMFCHTLLHPIGKKAGREYGSVAEAYKHGDTFCRSGYYHGVLEGIFGEEKGEEILANLDTLCATVNGKEEYSYDYFACVHGIGHGLMAYFDHDLFKSLLGCDKLSGEWEQSSCYGGVFMENVISDTAEEPSKFLKRDDPLYPCNVVEEKHRTECYQMQTSHMLALFEGDFEKTFTTCERAEEGFRISCYQSAGRDAAGWSYGSPEMALYYCAKGKIREQRVECVVGAASDFIQSVGVESARYTCSIAPEESRERCVKEIKWQIERL